MARYSVTACYVPALIKLGITCEVVDSTPPPDGGPTVVAFCLSAKDADRVCAALTLTERH